MPAQPNSLPKLNPPTRPDPPVPTPFNKLRDLLRTLFQLDEPDLDFGLYRVMHAKAAEITAFLDRDLLPQVKDGFALYQSADKAGLEAELKKAVEQAQALGADPETLPKVKDLRARLKAEAVDLPALEADVYDHLYRFFSRYYDHLYRFFSRYYSDGDFISKRRYSADGKYAIPYDGEEVKLHWANADQYYIKTSEYLRSYALRLRPDDDANPMRVRFELADAAEGEHGNVKAAAGKDRAFVIASTNAIFIENGELTIRFEYRPATISDWPAGSGKSKPPAQKDLTAATEARILKTDGPAFAPWVAELAKPHIKADDTAADYSRLRAHLNRYVARNTFDYFIHKDLGAFLRRELDFYIKNEVMHLDDIESQTVPRVEQYLSKIKVIRRIAGKIIAFLGQLEDFQRALWLKKKFVVETQWCVALKEVPEEFHKEIAANKAQQAEWKSLGFFDLPKEADGLFASSKSALRVPPSAMIDTRHFPAEFTSRLLDALGDLDEKSDGVLFHSENFQALSLMQTRYKEQVKCIYIDPPYNTDASAIIYKNDYKNSSWLALMENRLALSSQLLRDDAMTCIAIDDIELARLRCSLDQQFSPDSTLGIAVVRSNPAGRSTPKGFAEAHEYAVFVAASDESSVGRVPRNEKQLARYSESDGDGKYEWVNFRKHGGKEATRAARPKMYYPIFASGGAVRLPKIEWDSSKQAWDLTESPKKGEVVVWPINEGGIELRWKWGSESFTEKLDHFLSRPDQSGNPGIYLKSRMNEEGMLPVTWWENKEYSATEYGTNLLINYFGGVFDFTFPKAIRLVVDCLRASNCTARSQVLDYFGGSGTTGHAVIFLNREDDGGRKFTLVETGHHFDTVLLPRLKKVAFTPEWKDGKPKRPPTDEETERGPRLFKIVRLESYEDTLNNLELKRSAAQASLLDQPEAQGADKLREQYLLQYLLKVESRESPSLLNVAAFANPDSYRLTVKRPGSDESRDVCVDLLETFNWLLGLRVVHLAKPQSFTAQFERDSEKRLKLKGRLKEDAEGPFRFRRVEGTLPNGRKALVVWRTLTGNPEEDNLVLDVWMTEKLKISTKDFEFDAIYVNGGNNLENLKTPDDEWKVRLIEDDFHRLMFAAEGV